MDTPSPQTSASFANGITVPTTGTTLGQTGWDGSVCVISAFNPTPTSSAQGYQQGSLTLLTFSDGSTTVPPGQTKTLMLTEITPGGSTPLLGYNLLVAQANNLFPVASVGEMANLLSGAFPPVAVPGAAPQDSSSGLNGYVFVQNIQAFPSSNMAQSFTTALNSSSSAKSGDDIDTTMNAFFATTVNFKDVTLSTYLAAQSYVAAFAFAWADFQSQYTYYVYTTGQATGSTTAPAPGTAIALLGTITFNQNAVSGMPSLTDPTGGYTITYTPTSGAPVALTFANGQVLTANGGDEPSICLQGTFMNKSNCTGNQTDFGTIIPALAGTVFGQQAIATSVQQDLSSGGSKSGLQSFINSGGWQLTMGIMNIAMGIKAIGEIIGWVYGTVRGWWNGRNQPEAPPNEQQVQNQEQENLQEEQGELQNANPNANVPDGNELPGEQANLQNQVVGQNNAQQQQMEEGELQNEANQVEEQLELENNPNVENEAQELHDEEGELQQINPNDPNAGQELANVQGENVQLQQNIEQENVEIENQVGGQEAQQLQADAQVEEEQVEQQQEEEQQEENQEENEEKGEDGGEDEMVDDV